MCAYGLQCCCVGIRVDGRQLNSSTHIIDYQTPKSLNIIEQRIMYTTFIGLVHTLRSMNPIIELVRSWTVQLYPYSDIFGEDGAGNYDIAARCKM